MVTKVGDKQRNEVQLTQLLTQIIIEHTKKSLRKDKSDRFDDNELMTLTRW